MMRSSLGAAAASALTLVGAALAAPESGGNRHRTVAGWTIEDRAEQDGGRLVELRRDLGAIHLRYSAAFWRGNDGRVQSVLIERSDCTNGEEIGRYERPTARDLRVLFARALADCAVPPRRIALLLSGLEPASGLARRWGAEAEVATAAEAAAIAAHGAIDNAADSVAGQPPPRPD